jgi:RNA polymerase sigma-70 factor (ECF subfamily)
VSSHPCADEDSLSRQLVARHLRGEAEAFAALVGLYSGRVYNLALRFTGDPAEAEDLTQETFLRAYTALPRSRAELPFRPWLLHIAVNLCRDWARRKRPLAFSDLAGDSRDSGDGGDDFARDGGAIAAVPDPEPVPPEAAEAHEQLEHLRQAVRRLPPALQLIVTLRYNEALSYEEIGRLLDMPAASVGTSLLRARRRLRAALAELGEVDDDETS